MVRDIKIINTQLKENLSYKCKLYVFIKLFSFRGETIV